MKDWGREGVKELGASLRTEGSSLRTEGLIKV